LCELQFQNVGDRRSARSWPHPTDSFQHRHQGEFTLVDSNSEQWNCGSKGWVIASRGDCILICARRKAAEVAVRTAGQADHEHAAAVTLLFAEALPQDGSSDK
jgi:hypothetical protein